MKNKPLKFVLITLLFSLLVHPALWANEIIKPQRDNRSYRVITLANQLQAILVSDAELKQTAVSLSVMAGFNCDPANRPGLFHFMEHMLFLGTKKYPSSKEYGDYLAANGGSFNAFTSPEHTNYYFSINSDAIAGALDRFSQFFIAPLFDETYVNREMHAVDSEHAKNLKSDARRISQVVKKTSDPRHPFHKFGTGNLETLSNIGEDKIMETLKQQFKIHYSANLMKVGIVGNQSLDELEAMVRRYFSAIKNRNTVIPVNTHPPFSAAYLKKRLEIKPLKDIRALKLVFPIPDQRQYYREKPTYQLSRLLGYEGKGSLFSLLKSKNWAESLFAGASGGGSDFGVFTVNITLTDDGLNHQDDIIELVFQYVNLMKRIGPQKLYFLEDQKLSRIRFEFVKKIKPIDYAKSLAIRLQKYPARDLLRLMLLDQWDENLIRQTLERINPENMRIELVSNTAHTDQTEKWYGTAYSFRPIPQAKLDRWKNVKLNPALKLPEPNPFIPDDVVLSPLEKDLNYPEIIYDQPALKVWHKQDNRFDSPKVDAKFKLVSPVAAASPKTKLMTTLYASLLKDSLNEYSYPAFEAGLHYRVSTDRTGLTVQVSGYPEKMPILFETVIARMKTLQIDPVRFRTAFEKIKRSLNNHDIQESRSLTNYEFGHLLQQDFWHVSELLASIDSISHDDLQDFIPVLLSGLSAKGLIYGNMNRAAARQLIRVVETGLIEKVDMPSLYTDNRTAQLTTDHNWVYGQQVKDVNSSLIAYYQYGPETIHTTAVQSLMSKIMSRPFYNQLRTKEQLGYVVFSGGRNLNRVNGFRFLVQSSVKDPIYLQTRIDHFLKVYRTRLAALPEKRFRTFQNGLIKRLLQPTKNLEEEGRRYWAQISTERFEFDRIEKLAAALNTVTKQEVIDYYDRLFFQAPKRLTVLSFGNGHPLRKSPQGTPLTDPKAFKRRAAFYGQL